MKTAAILVAAGSSARMKSGGASKTMMEIGGEPVLSRTLRAFENAACISKIVIVARACDFDAIQKASVFVTKPLTITEGGKERQDSVSNGAALCGDAEYIAVHDAARPFITPEEIETVCADAEKIRRGDAGGAGERHHQGCCGGRHGARYAGEKHFACHSDAAGIPPFFV